MILNMQYTVHVSYVQYLWSDYTQTKQKVL